MANQFAVENDEQPDPFVVPDKCLILPCIKKSFN